MAAKKTNVPPVAPPTATPAVTPASADAPPEFTLDAPLRWKTATPQQQLVLENLQGNILKGHGRDQTMNIFFKLGDEPLLSKRVLRELGNFYVTSAYKQLLDTEAFKEAQKRCVEPCSDAGQTFYALFLSATGYQRLGLTFTPPDANEAFLPGMKAGTDDLKDPTSDRWEAEFQEVIDGMVLIADDNLTRGAAAVDKIVALLVASGATIVKKQAGKAIKNKAGNGLEHFGYVDGRSQPLMLVEDIESESADEGIAFWNPTAKLSKALVHDPLSTDPLSFGSFFIFRKLEEKVQEFKRKEQILANDLGLTGEARELAGALVVGRFEDGTPVTLSREARSMKKPKNDFNYGPAPADPPASTDPAVVAAMADSSGLRCPFHAHIRKTNPRGSGGFEDLEDEQLHIMARRGITYEDKPRIHPDDLPESDSLEEFEEKVAPLLPTGDVGLLFMAYNAKLDEQFVFTQKRWANGTGFPKVPEGAQPPGLDGVIGQPTTATDKHHYVKEWDNPGSDPVTSEGFNGFVIMKGGEYFFAPSLHFLRGL